MGGQAFWADDEKQLALPAWMAQKAAVKRVRERLGGVVPPEAKTDLSTSAGKLMLTMLVAVAELERENLKARQLAGLERARAEGRCLGRRKLIDDSKVVEWRRENAASIKVAAQFFGISVASVKRACAA